MLIQATEQVSVNTLTVTNLHKCKVLRVMCHILSHFQHLIFFQTLKSYASLPTLAFSFCAQYELSVTPLFHPGGIFILHTFRLQSADFPPTHCVRFSFHYVINIHSVLLFDVFTGVIHYSDPSKHSPRKKPDFYHLSLQIWSVRTVWFQAEVDTRCLQTHFKHIFCPILCVSFAVATIHVYSRGVTVAPQLNPNNSTTCLCLVVPLYSPHCIALAVWCDCFVWMHTTRF